MATIVLGEFGGGGATGVTIEMDVNAQNRVTAFRVINNSEDALYGELVGDEGSPAPGRKYSGVFLAHTTTEIPVPTTVGTRLQMRQVGTHLAGLDKHFIWPYRV